MRPLAGARRDVLIQLHHGARPLFPYGETRKRGVRSSSTRLRIGGKLLAWIVALAAVTLGYARGGEPAPTLPKGLPPDLWEILVPPENPVTPERVSAGAGALLRQAPLQGRHRLVRHLSRPGQGLRRRQGVWRAGRQEGRPQQPHRPERGLQRVPVLGWSRPEPRGAVQGAHDEPGRDGVRQPRRRRGACAPFLPTSSPSGRSSDTTPPSTTSRWPSPPSSGRRSRGLPVRSFPRRRRGGPLRVGGARLDALEHQGAVRRLPPVRRRDSQLQRQQVPQHRRRRQEPRLRRPRPRGGERGNPRRWRSTPTSPSWAVSSSRGSRRTSAP